MTDVKSLTARVLEAETLIKQTCETQREVISILLQENAQLRADVLELQEVLKKIHSPYKLRSEN